MSCNVHGDEAERVRTIQFNVYGCAGAHRGCGSFAVPPFVAAPGDPCPNCGGAITAAGTTPVRIGYCSGCLPQGLPRQFLPQHVPVNIVGGNPPPAL